MDTEDVVPMYNGILFSYKREQKNTICKNMDEPRDYHTKRKKNTIRYTLYVESQI